MKMKKLSGKEIVGGLLVGCVAVGFMAYNALAPSVLGSGTPSVVSATFPLDVDYTDSIWTEIKVDRQGQRMTLDILVSNPGPWESTTNYEPDLVDAHGRLIKPSDSSRWIGRTIAPGESQRVALDYELPSDASSSGWWLQGRGLGGWQTLREISVIDGSIR